MIKYIDILLYAVLTAVSFTFIDRLAISINPYLSLLYMAFCATFWFHLINYKTIVHVYKICMKNKMLYCYMSIIIGINWLCSIYAPHFSDPFIYLGVLFIVMSILGFVSAKNSTIVGFYINWLCVMMLIGCIIFIYYNYLIGENRSLKLGLVLGIMGGISAYYYAFFSNTLIKVSGFSITQILAIRFWPLIIGLGLYLITNKINFYLSIHNEFELILMSILGLILPVFFNQRAIQQLGVSKYAITAAITPVLTYITYSLSIKSFNQSNLVISIIITLVLAFSQAVKYSKNG